MKVMPLLAVAMNDQAELWPELVLGGWVVKDTNLRDADGPQRWLVVPRCETSTAGPPATERTRKIQELVYSEETQRCPKRK